MAVTPWVGTRRIAIVPVFNLQVDREPPSDWEHQVRRRVFYDPDPATGVDRSFQHFVQALSSGRASIGGEVFPAVWAENAAVNEPAYYSLPAGHGYTHMLAVLPHGAGEHRGGHAFAHGAINGIVGWARVAMFETPIMNVRQPLGVWGQELIHLLGYWDHTGLPGFDVMDGGGAMASVHACAHVKGLLGWLPSGLHEHVDGDLAVALHAVGQTHPAPAGRVSGVRVPSDVASKHVIIEGRTGTDQFDARLARKGVIVYDVAPTPSGGAVTLQSTGALVKGQTFSHPTEALQITVDDDVPGGFAVTIRKPVRRLVDRTAQYNTPAATGRPSTCYVPGLNAQNITYRDTSGRLHEFWRVGTGGTGTTNLTANASAPLSAGSPFAYVDVARNTVILLFRGGDGRVRSLYWSTGAVGHDDLSGTAGSPAAAGEPVGYYVPAGDVHHVIYRSANGHLHELWWAGVAPVAHGGDLTALASAPTAVGQPSAYFNSNGQNIVIFRGGGNRIRSLYWTSGDVGTEDLSGFAGTPTAVGDPLAYYTPHNDMNQILYVGADGHLWELFWPGVAPVAGWDVTAASSAPAPSGALAAYHHPATNTKHAVYRSANGRLHDLSWPATGGAIVHTDLTAFAGAPLAADAPAAFTVPAGTHHVVFRGADNHIYEIRR